MMLPSLDLSFSLFSLFLSSMKCYVDKLAKVNVLWKQVIYLLIILPPALQSVSPEEPSTARHSKKLGASLRPRPFLVQLFRTATQLLQSNNHLAGRSMTLTPRILPSCHSKKVTSFSWKRKSMRIGMREPSTAVPDTSPSLTSQSLTLFQSFN